VVRYLVEFVKSIPGFRELSISDQSSLLKGKHQYDISYTVKPAHVVTSIKQLPVLKGHPFLVLS
jgi:hypothetical protein